VTDNRLLRVSAYVEECTRTVRLMTISNYESQIEFFFAKFMKNVATRSLNLT